MNDASQNDELTNKFDNIVGKLEEVVLRDEFEELQTSFCRQHCTHFDATDENKLIYTELFQKYTELIEQYLEKELSSAVEGFDMVEFMEMLSEREDELAGEVFDLLLSLSDFQTFKDIMVSYKQDGAGGPMSSSSNGLSLVVRYL